MKKVLFLLLPIISALSAHSQKTSTFADFANKQNTELVAAYEQKDIKKYNKCFSELLNNYSALSAKDKAENWEFISTAYYNRACTYALVGDKKHALDDLEKSKYHNYKHLLVDGDLTSLRNDPRFIKFMNVEKNYKNDKYQTLKAAPAYANKKSIAPAFTYQSYTTPKLAKLRKKYNLDSIAGQGSDVTQMINLMRWVHNLVPHNGNEGNPGDKNALDFITVCRRDGKTLNCRGLAILLNEVYLAEGFKSRFVTCLPKDTADGDCHVITSVYSDELKKWIWMDPTFMAYVMDEKGNLLGIEEVRDRIIHNKPLLINPDANHNNENSESVNYYLYYYMAKNLYYLECPVSSEYNYETYEDGKQTQYVRLVPGDKISSPNVVKNEHGIVRRTLYYSGDPKAFWEPPAVTTLTDYKTALDKFQRCYNAQQADSLCEQYSAIWGKRRTSMWNTKEIESLQREYGKMKSFKFMGVEPEENVMLFKTEWEKSTHATGLSLDRFGKIATFRFKTSSGYINDLLSKN